jgi:hypothetical protein
VQTHADDRHIIRLGHLGSSSQNVLGKGAACRRD